MKARIDYICLWTDNFVAMTNFYQNVMGFSVKWTDNDNYTEFENDGVRFAVAERNIMKDFHPSFRDKPVGRQFELAFACATPAEVDQSFEALIAKGAVAVHAPENMPWGQRTGLFADPDGNVHELFAPLE